jgi:hypothetical protein
MQLYLTLSPIPKPRDSVSGIRADVVFFSAGRTDFGVSGLCTLYPKVFYTPPNQIALTEERNGTRSSSESLLSQAYMNGPKILTQCYISGVSFTCKGHDVKVAAPIWFIKNRLVDFHFTLRTFIEMASTFIFCPTVPISTYRVTDFTLWGTNFILWGKPHYWQHTRTHCAVTSKVKVPIPWIQQLAMRTSAFYVSKYPDKMKVPAHICA